MEVWFQITNPSGKWAVCSSRCCNFVPDHQVAPEQAGCPSGTIRPCLLVLLESCLEELLAAHFWLAVGQIILIDILSWRRNNCRRDRAGVSSIANHLRKHWHSVGYSCGYRLQVILIAFTLSLLKVPFLKTGWWRIAVGQLV